MQFQLVILATLFAATQAVPRAAPAIPQGWMKVSEPSQGQPWCIAWHNAGRGEDPHCPKDWPKDCHIPGGTLPFCCISSCPKEG
ncbi:hypothetical protein K449DRAFT_463056 [Hypoxylon sp. EC38]|nr:hypothetical protein K449DRAFT_463056 [Hypoxylon sp. EC38]